MVDIPVPLKGRKGMRLSAERPSALPSARRVAGVAVPAKRRSLGLAAKVDPNGDPPPLMLWGEE